MSSDCLQCLITLSSLLLILCLTIVGLHCINSHCRKLSLFLLLNIINIIINNNINNSTTIVLLSPSRSGLPE